ncbi:MAG: polyprenol monophosphomannose synthase [Candidatus Delongbacteria bacterium]|nr:polyprenol monophosphomannose synthase [Candidatus Cloacimonadota bacterium]MCB9474082.1 polyprenol monophosphomannose synthase [Candidatus Delongbacteria bacterium]
MTRMLVIVPTYNEAENIERLADEVLAQDACIELLVVDDNSPDGTGEIADRLAGDSGRVHVLHRAGKLGLGTAYVAGFRWAIERGYDYICEMDADFSHDPRVLPVFLKTIGEADLVIGSRYVTGVNVVNWPLSRLLLSYGASMYTRIITGMPVKDPTGGFKCFRRQTLEALDLDRIRSGGYSFQIEVNFKVWRKGLRIQEIPIIFVDRAVGRSKMSKAIVREAVWMVWRLKLRSLLGRL